MPAANPKDIYEALFAFQADPPSLTKDGYNPHFKNKYVTLEQVVDRVIPALREQGIMALQPVSNVGEASALCTILRHMPSGTQMEYEMPLVMDRVAPQAQGSAITFARRYALLSFLGLVSDEDNDAQTGSIPTDGAGAATTSGTSPFGGSL